MSAHDTLRQARQFISAQNGVISPLPLSEEELNPTIQDDLSLQAIPLESTNTCYPVNFNFPNDSLCSEFSFFEDGRQRTVQIGFIPTMVGKTQVLVPVHFFVVAAVVMKREECKLKVWSAPKIEQGIFIEKSLVPDQRILQGFEQAGLNVVHIVAKGGDYYELKKRALQEAKNVKIALHILKPYQHASD